MATVTKGTGSDSSFGIIVGAATFPNMPSLESPVQAAAFALSKQVVTADLAESCTEYLDLFDSPVLPSQILLSIAEFLGERSHAKDLVVYYVGHGGFLRNQDYFLACHLTSERNKHVTGLRMEDLATTILDSTNDCRAYVILDCCFAGSAVPLFQAGEGAVLVAQLDKIPTGVAILAASSRRKAAIVPEHGTMTMFSEALHLVLSEGVHLNRQRLTLREVGEAITYRIRDTHALDATLPEVHSPRQREGDPADHPFFPNAGFVDPNSPDETTYTLPHRVDPDLPEGFSLRLTNGPEAGLIFPLSDGVRVVVGRALGCDIVLDDRAISQRHAALRVEGQYVVVEDLDSTNGLLVNGELSAQASLSEGDWMQIGETVFVVAYGFEHDDEDDPEPAASDGGT